MSIVIVKTNESNIKENVYKALSILNFKPKREKVLIKPNICAPVKPETAIITDPKVVASIIDYLRDIGIKEIFIGEGSAVSYDTNKCFEVSGFKKLCKEKKVRLINLNNAERTMVKWCYGKIKIPSILQSCSLINVPKMKIHPFTTITIGIKNLKGIMLPKDKKRSHLLGLHEPIAEFAKIIQPEFTIVDGIYGAEAGGLITEWKRKKIGVIVAGYDPVGVDAVCSKIIGINPRKVKHLVIAEKVGVGRIKQKIIGEKLTNVKCKIRIPDEKCKRFFKLRKWRNPNACSMCDDQLKFLFSDWKFIIRNWPVLFLYTFVTGIDIIVGRKARIPKKHGKVICLGNCTKSIAQRYNFEWIEGCPPQIKDIREIFKFG